MSQSGGNTVSSNNRLVAAAKPFVPASSKAPSSKPSPSSSSSSSSSFTARARPFVPSASAASFNPSQLPQQQQQHVDGEHVSFQQPEYTTPFSSSTPLGQVGSGNESGGEGDSGGAASNTLFQQLSGATAFHHSFQASPSLDQPPAPQSAASLDDSTAAYSLPVVGGDNGEGDGAAAVAALAAQTFLQNTMSSGSPANSSALSHTAHALATPALHAPPPVILPQQRAPRSCFMPELLRGELAAKRALITTRLQPSDPAFASMPSLLNDEYHSVTPLNEEANFDVIHDIMTQLGVDPSAHSHSHTHRHANISKTSTTSPFLTTVPPSTSIPSSRAATVMGGGSSMFPYRSILYKGTSVSDGYTYLIRRYGGVRVSMEMAQQAVAPWLTLQRNYSTSPLFTPPPHTSSPPTTTIEYGHPNILPLHDVFSSTDFGDGGSLIFVYPYYPASETLLQRYLLPRSSSQSLHQGPPLIHEPVLWSTINQILAALTAIHSMNMAAPGLIYLNRLLVTSTNRIRVNCCGVWEALQLSSSINKSLRQLQCEDLYNLGVLILQLCCQSLNALLNLNKSIEYVASRFSPDVKNLITFLLTKTKDIRSAPSVFNVSNAIAHRTMEELQRAYLHIDALEVELAKEAENGRLFRLLAKLDFIHDRTDIAGWSTTAGRYLLQLFHDLLFQQTTTLNTPNLDFAHVVDNLNKLDAGVGEKTLLSSRTGESLLIVRFADLRRCVDESFVDLAKQSVHRTPQQLQPRAPQTSMSAITATAATTILHQQRQQQHQLLQMQQFGYTPAASAVSAGVNMNDMSGMLDPTATGYHLLASQTSTLPPQPNYSFQRSSTLFVPPSDTNPYSYPSQQF